MTRGAVRPTRRERGIVLLRWTCVLPAAVLGGSAASYNGGLASRLVASRWGTPAESGFASGLRLLMFSVPKEAVFVIAGAMTAPRHRLATTIVLATAAIAMSLVVHVLGQRNPGVVNFTHFAAESAGVALGVACNFFSDFGSRRGARR